MCDDGAVVDPPALSRRDLIRGVGASAAAALVLGEGWQRPAQAASGPATMTFDGTQARSMAMHVHASFSEQTGSMEAQLLQAQQNAVDVLWWTDHDHRMEALHYRNVVHFTSLTAETTDGNTASHAWRWVRRTSGPLASSSSGGIASTGSPNDPVSGGSLSLTAQSTSAATAILGFFANTQRGNYNERANLYGQTWSIEVLPTRVGLTGYLELLISSSLHPARGGRPAGNYSLSYRFGGSGVPGSRTATGLLGVISVPVVPGQWNTITINPCEDIAALWPDMDNRDFASYGITLSAVSNGLLTSGSFDYLQFSRPYSSGDFPLQTQRDISAGYAPMFPSVSQRQGVEMSLFDPHLNWFGGAVSLPTYEGVTAATYLAYIQTQVTAVHAAGGLASYNHPYGSSGGALLSQAAQDTKMSQTATALLNNKALGTDIIEVGYPQRAGVDLDHHVKLWDILSRNALTLTGNGGNDDHMGQNWYGSSSNWTTSVWTASTDEIDLLNALRAGRAWTGSLRYPCSLDLLVDNTCPMGSVSVALLTQRQLQVFASGIPGGGSVQVLRGEVDYAGTAAPVPNTALIASYPDTAFTAGSVSLLVDTTTSCFVRTAVRTSTGAVIALSNPIWLLHETPPEGIPAARYC